MDYSRRDFVARLALAGTAGLLGMRPRTASAAPPPETSRVRLPQTPAMCEAPQYLVSDLLRAEGFSAVDYVKVDLAYPSPTSLERLLESGAIDLGFNFAAPALVKID